MVTASQKMIKPNKDLETPRIAWITMSAFGDAYKCHPLAAVESTTIGAMPENYIFFIVSLCFSVLVSADLGRPFEPANGNLKLEEQPLNVQLQTENGDHYMCVNVYKQPAFQNPLLRNHILQWSPAVYPTKTQSPTSFDEQITRIPTSNKQLCPQRAIPVLVRQSRKKINENSAPNNNTNDLLYRFAILKMLNLPNENFLGGQATMTVDNPPCRSGQSSGASIWIGSDNSDQRNVINAGWIVDPDAYGDSQTRLSIYWTADGYHKMGCYDLQCPGFVQVSNNYILGAPIAPVSIFGQKQYEIFISIFQDAITKHWWLQLSNGEETLDVGYWPRELFSRFGNGATVLNFGGRAGAPPGQAFPMMGFGLFPDQNFRHASLFRHVSVVNKTNFIVPPNIAYQVSSDSPRCYILTFKEFGVEKELIHSISFGGPGGHC